jgi:hypothetical protein
LTPVDELGAVISDLNPIVHLGGRDYAFVGQALATLTKRELGDMSVH